MAPWVVKQVPNLFSLSERVMLGGYWEHGFFSLTAVGAYNVGSIEIDMDKVHRGREEGVNVAIIIFSTSIYMPLPSRSC